MTKSNLGRKGFIWFTYPELQSTKGSQSRDSHQAGTQERSDLAEATEEHCLLAFSVWLLKALRVTSPELGPKTWALPCQSLFKKVPCRPDYSPILQSHFSQRRLHPLLLMLAFVKLL